MIYEEQFGKSNLIIVRAVKLKREVRREYRNRLDRIFQKDRIYTGVNIADYLACLLAERLPVFHPLLRMALISA